MAFFARSNGLSYPDCLLIETYIFETVMVVLVEKRPQHLSAFLQRVLVEQAGETDAVSARHAIDSFFPDSETLDPDRNFGKVPLDTQLNLYQSIAADRHHTRKTLYLARINNSLNLPRAAIEAYSRQVENYFSCRIFRDFDRFNHPNSPIVNTLDRLVKDDPTLDIEDWKKAARFLARGYAHYRKIKIHVAFFEVIRAFRNQNRAAGRV